MWVGFGVRVYVGFGVRVAVGSAVAVAVAVRRGTVGVAVSSTEPTALVGVVCVHAGVNTSRSSRNAPIPLDSVVC